MFDEREGGEGKKKAAVKLRFSDHERLKHRARSLSLSLSRYSWLDWKRETRDPVISNILFSPFFFFFDIQFPQPDQRHVLKVEQVFIIWVKLFEDICHWDWFWKLID